MTQFIYSENYFVCFSVIVSCAISQGWVVVLKILTSSAPLPAEKHTLALYHPLFHFHTLTWDSSKCLYFLILFLIYFFGFAHISSPLPPAAAHQILEDVPEAIRY